MNCYGNFRPTSCKTCASDDITGIPFAQRSAFPPAPGRGLRRCDRDLARRRAGEGRAGGRRSGRARSRLLGPAATAGTARPVPHQRDPLPHGNRLSAVQFRGPGRQSPGVQYRSGAHDVRGAQARLHHPDAPVRDADCGAQCEPGRRRHRLDRSDGGHAPQGQLQRFLLPHAGALRHQTGFSDRGPAAGAARRQEGGCGRQ